MTGGGRGEEEKALCIRQLLDTRQLISFHCIQGRNQLINVLFWFAISADIRVIK